MSWTAPRTWVTGELVTATLMNTHLRDNLLETAPAKVTTAGDIVYASAANALARLAIAAADGALLQRASGLPAWLAIGTAAGNRLQTNSGLTAPEWVKYPSAAILSAIGAQTIANNTPTVADFAGGSVLFDTDSCADIANDRLVCNTAGLYLIIGSITWTANATGTRGCRILVGGTIYASVSEPATSTNTHTQQALLLRNLAASDAVTLGVFQTSGGNLDLVPRVNETLQLSMVRIA